MPTGDSITVTIICETIPDNEPSAACAGSGSERRRSLPPIKLSKTQDSRPTPRTRILHCVDVMCVGFENSSGSLDHRFGYENNEAEKRGSCQTQSTSAMSFHQAGSFLRPRVKRVSRETQKIKSPYVLVQFKLISPRVSAFPSSLWFARGNVTLVPASGYIGIVFVRLYKKHFLYFRT